MSGETNLETLIAAMRPVLRDGTFVFVTVEPEAARVIPAEAMVVETESTTLVLRQADADVRGLAYDYVARWITLEVHSSLAAVGLTAAFSTVLGVAGISCNVLAGYHHDHLLVSAADAQRALEVLQDMSTR